MQSDKDNSARSTEPMLDTIESFKESTLEWLMELDRDEPEESLFVVEGKLSADFSLSAYEAEVAARPMVRGRAGADDLDTYIGEEIVLSEAGGNDIYNGGGETTQLQEAEEDAFEGLMAIEFSRVSNEEAEGLATNVVDGSDILGLEDDDDIGDSYLVVKRVKKVAPQQVQPGPAIAEPLAAGPAEVEPIAIEPAAVQPLEEVYLEAESAEYGEEIPAQADTPLHEVDIPGEICVEAASVDADASWAENDNAEIDTPPADVNEYVNSVQLPQDDEAFDDFLIAGNTLAVGEEDFDGLSLETSIDQFTADADVESDLDLHEDFASMEGFGENLMSVITPRLADFMDEVNAALAARMSAMGRPADSVIADVSVATDEQTASLAVKQGYEPVSRVCAEVPEALAGLEQRQVDAVLLRLVDVANGANCNRLFQEEPASAPMTEEPGLTVVESSVLGDDLLDEAFAGGTSSPDWSPDSAEIDAIFDDLDGGDRDLEFDAPAPEVEGFVGFASEEAPVAPASIENDTLEVFEESIFESELEPVNETIEAASGEDIDQLFSELGMDSENSGEICGVEVEEFTGADGASASDEARVTETPDAPVAVAVVDEDLSWCIPEGINFSHSSPGGGEIFAEFLDAFIEEGSSELEKLEDAISAWEADIGSEASYAQVARILHTVKGIAKGVGLHYYGTLVHNFETLLEALPRPVAEGAGDYFRIVNAWLDAAVRGMEFVQEQRRDILSEFPHRGASPADVAEPVVDATTDHSVTENSEQSTEQVIPATAASDQADRDRKRKQEDKKLADEGARALAAQQSVRITSEKLDLLLNLTNQAQQLGVRTAQSTNRNKRASAELQGRLSSVRAHIADIADRALFNVNARSSNHSAELDALEMDQYSELQEAANILREGVEDLADLIELASRHNAQAEALLKQQATVISSIGSSIRAARVVPVSRLMPGLRRLVRTVSNDLGKDVAFRVANEVGTLDRDDYARCQTILEHMVRNALDHGIESTEERKASGKPSVGQVTLDVRMSGSDSIIVLSDDGRGIDPEAMRESAVRKGLDVDADALSDEEALNLIFHKGFSTAAQLSQISGRGVGMDIVRSELQEMGGDVRIESEVGKGTSFHVRIPTNVTVNGALLVTSGENSYAIPLGGLVCVDEVPVDDFFAAVERGETMRLQGMECEPAYLGTLCNSGSLPDRSSWRSTLPVIVAGSESRYMAIAIDDVEEALELVIRSLGAQFASVPGVAGAATTADGEAVVALDLNVLVSCYGDGQGIAVPEDQPEEDKFVALVVDDSRTQRMVATSQLETVGIETATAENGAVAIDWLNTTEQLPDVILLDVEMPVKDGIQTLREIRNSARYSHIPVIMITSRTGVKHRTLAEEAGCNGYMGKPFNFRMLIGQINELTGQRLELG
ncbi:hybrid sensor histidine kinase/response regulator [Seongchinamella unica]|uniref:hybrid sensor histidine kinase/response regulator n=1 Tax=Seongchinamella unica TaxID=2547392 RepID=UPI00140498BC|nr:response regulator [Seongchinamella unica]